MSQKTFSNSEGLVLLVCNSKPSNSHSDQIASMHRLFKAIDYVCSELVHWRGESKDEDRFNLL